MIETMTTKNEDVKNWRPPRKMRLDHLLLDWHPLAPTLQSAPLSKGEGYKQIKSHKFAKHLQITL